MQIDPYLWFSGNCKEAFQFYEKVLGGKITMMMTHGESPAAQSAAPDWQDKIMHVRLEAQGQALMGSDIPSEHFAKPDGFSVSITVTEVADAERIFNGLIEGGQVRMPMSQTFWSPAFGMAVDRFGIPWMVNCAAPM